MLDPRIKDVVSGSDRDRYPQIENFHASRVAGLRSVLVQKLNDMAVGVGDVDLLNVVVTDARPTHPFKSAFAHHCEERLKRIHHDREVMAEARAQFLTTPLRSMAGQPSWSETQARSTVSSASPTRCVRMHRARCVLCTTQASNALSC